MKIQWDPKTNVVKHTTQGKRAIWCNSYMNGYISCSSITIFPYADCFPLSSTSPLHTQLTNINFAFKQEGIRFVMPKFLNSDYIPQKFILKELCWERICYVNTPKNISKSTRKVWLQHQTESCNHSQSKGTHLSIIFSREF